MEMIDRLREIMEKEYGIRTDVDLLKAVEDCPGPDFGIFVLPVQNNVSHAV